MTVHKHGVGESGLNFLVIGFCRFVFHFHSSDLAVQNRFDELDDIIGLTLISEYDGGVAGGRIRACISSSTISKRGLRRGSYQGL